MAFIGVGTMAAEMVWRCVEGGWRAHLIDPSPEATQPFQGQAGVVIHESVGPLVRDAEIVLLSLPTPTALLEVSKQLAACGPAPRPIPVINTSTSGLAATRAADAELTTAGFAFVDAPVSGGRAGARQGTLTVMVSGPLKAIDTCAPVFEVIGQHIVHVGSEPGQAQVMKVANNVLSLGALAATAEATALTSRAGIPLEVAIDALNASSGQNSATAVKIPNHVLTGAFDFGFPVEGALKDVSLFTDVADELGVSAPLAQAVVGCWQLAVEQGYGMQDCTRITTMYERMAGLGADDGGPQDGGSRE
ncbi:NAD(P)-dependent oxidoreductase [Streptomyces anthocyanicus]|uniref:NAD(P)-dependent oxidoreductase n=1 Tax=Streptomyces anthocyanicus TaxID=68174 RepID=UPI00386D4568|nr:NAD(P)-dependent oxidoreductase [Streptomyces anthocyanicus]